MSEAELEELERKETEVQLNIESPTYFWVILLFFNVDAFKHCFCTLYRVCFFFYISIDEI